MFIVKFLKNFKIYEVKFVIYRIRIVVLGSNSYITSKISVHRGSFHGSYFLKVI